MLTCKLTLGRSLHQALLIAAPYEALYNDLLEKQAILESRENAAIDEAERLGLQNAELLGHTNSDQRISYIEGVRRDMALAKQVSNRDLCFSMYLVEEDKVEHRADMMLNYRNSPRRDICSTRQTTIFPRWNRRWTRTNL